MSTASEPEGKRQKRTMDEIVGLELTEAGRVFNVPLSTLRHAGGYFTARFGGSDIPPGSERVGEHGRSIYYVPRETKLFENHILPYLLTCKPGGLPPFSEDPMLWRQLRDEAQFFCLQGLVDKLHVTYSCEPNESGRGILYWLGTRQGKHRYENPCALGVVHVGGWFELTEEERTAEQHANSQYLEDTLVAGSPESRQALVQYRPPVQGVKSREDFENIPDQALECKQKCLLFLYPRAPVVIKFESSAQVRLRAYSLRCDGSLGIQVDWNLEGSKDGSTWVVLHAVRNSSPLLGPSSDGTICPYSRLFQHWVSSEHDDATLETRKKESSEQLLQYVESVHRHTWNIEPQNDEFYRFFRIVPSGEEDTVLVYDVVGLELYGEVHEE